MGLISDLAWHDHLAKQERLESLKQWLEKTKLTSAMLETMQLAAAETAGPGDSPVHAESGEAAALRPAPASTDLSAALGQSLAQLLRRPEISIELLLPCLGEGAAGFLARDEMERKPRESKASTSSAVRNELKSVETEIKYAGYLQQQQKAIARMKKAEQRSIPDWFDYRSVSGLSREMQEKLVKVRPRTLAQASNIPGVTPAAVSLVNVFIEIQARRREQALTL